MKFFFVINCMLCLFIQSEAAAQKAKLPVCKHSFIVIAHRGDHTQAPENTLQSCQNAINAGCDFVEIDLRTTKDSVLVIMHDANINRMSDRSGNVKDFLFDSLRLINVKDKIHPEWGSYPIPSFKEVLNMCKGKINIYLDFKDADVTAAYNEIAAAGMEKNVVVYVNTMEQYTQWKSIVPQMPLMVSLPENITAKKELDQFLNSYTISVLDGNYKQYNAPMIKCASEKGVPVWADVQSNDESSGIWEKAIALGLTGLQTDHPGKLIEYLIRKNIR